MLGNALSASAGFGVQGDWRFIGALLAVSRQPQLCDKLVRQRIIGFRTRPKTAVHFTAIPATVASDLLLASTAITVIADIDQLWTGAALNLHALLDDAFADSKTYPGTSANAKFYLPHSVLGLRDRETGSG